MFEEKHIPNRRKGEHLITFVRPHWLKLAQSIALVALLWLIPFVLYFLLLDTIPFLFENQIPYILIIMIAVVYYLMTYTILYNRFIDYHLDIWIVTNYRIIAIVQNNIFNRTISEHVIENIQDVSANQLGFWQTFFEYGDVQIQTAGEEQMFEFNDVPKPFEVAKEINDLVHKLSTKKNTKL